jgi:hypothetical protein
MKAGPDRRYTAEFRESALKQVTQEWATDSGGRSVPEASGESLANWVYRARKGQELVGHAPVRPKSVSRPRADAGAAGLGDQALGFGDRGGEDRASMTLRRGCVHRPIP